ncbi:MAG: retropepsin-like aspartic protease, partial [Flavobacteriales bacterium]
ADYDIGALMDLNKYCECALSRIIEQHGFDSSGIQNLKDRNSVLFNELAVTCVEAAMYQAMDRKGSVAGMHNSDTIAVLNADRGYKVKITVGNEQAYFLFDSGASDILVSTDFEKKMNENGAIQGYLENMSYELANGDLIDCKRAIVNDIQIGEFLVDSVVVAIYDRDIGFLLGKSFMDKFSSWKFIDNGNALVLVK